MLVPPLNFNAPYYLTLSEENQALGQQLQQAENQKLIEMLQPISGLSLLIFFLLLLIISSIYFIYAFKQKSPPKKRGKGGFFNTRVHMAKLKSQGFISSGEYAEHIGELDSILKIYLSRTGDIKSQTMSSEEIVHFLKNKYPDSGLEEKSKTFFHLKDMAKFGHYPLDKQDTLQAEKLVLEVIKAVERSTGR